jgi:hypothetical protein
VLIFLTLSRNNGKLTELAFLKKDKVKEDAYNQSACSQGAKESYAEVQGSGAAI